MSTRGWKRQANRSTDRLTETKKGAKKQTWRTDIRTKESKETVHSRKSISQILCEYRRKWIIDNCRVDAWVNWIAEYCGALLVCCWCAYFFFFLEFLTFIHFVSSLAHFLRAFKLLIRPFGLRSWNKCQQLLAFGRLWLLMSQDLTANQTMTDLLDYSWVTLM